MLWRCLHAVTIRLFRYTCGFLLVVGLILVLLQVAEAGASVGEVGATIDVDVAVRVQRLQGRALVMPVLSVKDMRPPGRRLLVIGPCGLPKSQLRR